MEERREARWLLRACIMLGAIAGAALAGEFVAGSGAAIIALAGLGGGTAGALIGYSAAYPDYRGICSPGGERARTKGVESHGETPDETSPEAGAHVSRLLEERSRAMRER